MGDRTDVMYEFLCNQTWWKAVAVESSWKNATYGSTDSVVALLKHWVHG